LDVVINKLVFPCALRYQLVGEVKEFEKIQLQEKVTDFLFGSRSSPHISSTIVLT